MLKDCPVRRLRQKAGHLEPAGRRERPAPRARNPLPCLGLGPATRTASRCRAPPRLAREQPWHPGRSTPPSGTFAACAGGGNPSDSGNASLGPTERHGRESKASGKANAKTFGRFDCVALRFCLLGQGLQVSLEGESGRRPGCVTREHRPLMSLWCMGQGHLAKGTGQGSREDNPTRVRTLLSALSDLCVHLLCPLPSQEVGGAPVHMLLIQTWRPTHGPSAGR